MIKRVLLLSCATGALGLLAGAAHAATAQANAQATASVGEIVVTAEKREQNIQTVPIAITAFTSKERDTVGINSIQDMTNFTPGLNYSTSTDRITLRGVGRTTNVLSADAPVANYDDGLYETFAVAAGRSSLELADVDIQRGPQGTLGGRNALAGSLDEVTRKPTDTLFAEARLTLGNYDHLSAEADVSGPINDVWKFRAYFQYEYQGQGWIKNEVPGEPSEGNNINEWYTDLQVQAHFSDKLDMWTKFQSAMWYNPSGGPGDQSDGWTPVGFPTYEYGVAALGPSAGYACAPGFQGNSVKNVSPAGCYNPALKSPWTEAIDFGHTVILPAYYSLNSQWTYHEQGFDIKLISGGTYYHYQLFGPTGGNDAPILSYNEPCAFYPAGVDCGALDASVHPEATFEYQEFNGFWSDELNFISTAPGPLQWVAGVYQFQQNERQPVSEEVPGQPGIMGPFSPFSYCTATPCVPNTNSTLYDDRPEINDTTLAAYGQIDWKFTPTWKLTLGVRYNYDRKYGDEMNRLDCYGVCVYPLADTDYLYPLIGSDLIDLTEDTAVVQTCKPGSCQQGVVGPTTYSAITGFATRRVDGNWESPSGQAGLEWTPDSDSLYYLKYGYGYSAGGFNIGIFTVISPHPFADAQHVQSLEAGAKHTFGDFLTVDAALYYYYYTDFQIPLSLVNTGGGLAQSQFEFFNVPVAISEGFELETTWHPIQNATIAVNYSYNDAYVQQGSAPDPADPNAYGPGAKPLYTGPQCAASAAAGHPLCAPDIYSAGIANDPGAGWDISQNLAGNPLPNAPRNKFSVNAFYAITDGMGGKWTPAMSWVWRDEEYGLFFNEPFWAAPSWSQWDARLSYDSPNGKFEAILFIKNILNTVGYDQGPVATRAAGEVPIAGPTGYYSYVPYVQGLNGPAGFNQHLAGSNNMGIYDTYYVVPPRTFGIELHYKFF